MDVTPAQAAMSVATLGCIIAILSAGGGQVAADSGTGGELFDLTREDFLSLLTKKHNFENSVPPDYDSDYPTEVRCQIFVENFDAINEANMDFTVTVLLHVAWFDHRFSNYGIKEGHVEIDSKNIDMLWVPDLYFPNEKDANYHNVLMPNKMLRIYQGGYVFYSTRLTLTLSCPMDFRNYPFDKQYCKVLIESFSYNDGNILLRWAADESANSTNVTKATLQGAAVILDRSVSLPQFEILDIKTFDDYTRTRRGLGNHSALRVEFTLARNIGYYLVQMYIPSGLVVMLSWISFWLNVNAVPGRISLGVLTVLTMTTQSSGVNASLPHVSYTKAIDIWMSMCLLFVFLALIEFAVANVLIRKDMNKGIKFKNIFSIPRANSGKHPPTKEKFTEDTRDPENGFGETSAVRAKRKKLNSGVLYSMYCDVGSRIAFPALFVLFNIIYWSYFAMQLKADD